LRDNMLQGKRLRDIALQIHKMNRMITLSCLHTFWTRMAKKLADKRWCFCIKH
jgi:hypothetical protein